MKADRGAGGGRGVGAYLLWTLWALKRVFAGMPFRRRPQHFDWLRRLYRLVLARLIARTGLFDAAYYLEANPGVAQAGCDPLVHYVSHGEIEGRQPLPLFDPRHYRAQCGAGSHVVNCLLHYAWIGRARGLSPSGWFDPQYYIAHNADVVAAGVDPLQHYLACGGIEGRSPCPRFDGLYYLKSNPDVAAARVNPLLHYLHYGRTEGRRPMPTEAAEIVETFALGAVEAARLPSEQEWKEARPRLDREGLAVDVVVPVYKGRAETLCCLLSVLRSTCQTPFALVVINDASPDPALSADLERLAGRGLFTLLVNERNLGFVRTVNRGMARNPGRDVVLLNSDTEVYGNWLDRLRLAAEADPRTGTVTPLSNSATICSYPRFPHDNPYPLELGYAELDALAAQVNSGVRTEAPSGVGFCFYIRASCLKSVGAFDAETFGRGYGEENDFCQRALRKGWHNLIAADVFVRHWGSTSFAEEKAQRVREALQIIDRRYPSYHKDVARFIGKDPLLPARRRMDWARFRRQTRERNALLVCHSRGGGTERRLQDDLRRLQAQGVGTFLLRPKIGSNTEVALAHPLVRNVPNLQGLTFADVSALETACRELNITEIHCHSFVGFAAEAAQGIQRIASALGARLEVNIHDYEMVCPRINLVDEAGIYCGEPDEAGCNRCLASRGSEFSAANVSHWRERFRGVLASADQIMVPDGDVAQRLRRYFPGIDPRVAPHEEQDCAEMTEPLLAADQRLRVVVIGAISIFKGYDILLKCAQAARRQGLPLDFILMGYSMDDIMLQKAGVHVTGRYEESESVRMLAELAPGLVWLPSTWPETYSYTLSLALTAGCPVLAFDIGAIASRLRAVGRDQHLMPLTAMKDAEAVNAQLMAYRETLLSKAGQAGTQDRAVIGSRRAAGEGAGMARSARAD